MRAHLTGILQKLWPTPAKAHPAVVLAALGAMVFFPAFALDFTAPANRPIKAPAGGYG